MKLKGLVDEDFVQYKKPSMFVIAPYCTFKCDKEAGCNVCQNSDLAAAPIIEMDDIDIWIRYAQNPITEAIVFGGLEPFDPNWWADFGAFILKMRDNPDNDNDDIVIYTGFYPSEIKPLLHCIDRKKNIIVKFGRFIPNRPSRFDKVLGVELASNNQFAVKLGKLDWDKQEALLYRLEQYYRYMSPEDIKALEEKFE